MSSYCCVLCLVVCYTMELDIHVLGYTYEGELRGSASQVLAVVLAGVAILLMFLSVAATTWLESTCQSEGLWEKCRYRENSTTHVDCGVNIARDWLRACRGLSLAALFVTLLGIVLTSLGINCQAVRSKNRLYLAGMTVFFIAVALQLTALVTFPVKFLEEILTQEENHWQFGWAYGIGWTAAVTVFVSGILVLVDKNADEIVYKETTVKMGGIEDEPLARV